MQKTTFYGREFDILRGFAIFGVIIIHNFSYSYMFHTIDFPLFIIAIIRAIASSAVPTFIFISGYCNYSIYNKNYSYISFWKKKVKRILTNYTCYSILYFCLMLFLQPNLFPDLNSRLFQFLIDYLTFSVYYHFWFIGLILSFYLFYPLIERLISKHEEKIEFILIISIIIQIFWYIFRIFLFDFVNQPFFPPLLQIFLNKTIKYAFLSYISYFIFGILFYQKIQKISNLKYERVKNLIILIIPVIIITSIEFSFLYINQNYGNISFSLIKNFGVLLFFPCILSFLFLSFKISQTKKISNKVFSLLGRHSFSIYLIHPFFIFFIQKYLFYLFRGLLIDWVFKIFVILTTMILSLIFSYSTKQLIKGKLLVRKWKKNIK